MENSSLQNGTSKSSADSFGFGLQLQSSGDESSSPESEPISSRALSLTKFSSSTTEIQTDPLSATGLVVCCFCHGQMEAKLPVALPKLLANVGFLYGETELFSNLPLILQNSRPPPALKVEPVDSDSAERSGSQPAEVTAVKRPRGRPPRNGYKKKRLDESTNEQNLRVKQAEEMRRTTRGSVATNSPTRRNSSLSNGSGRGSPRRIGRKRRLKAAACNLDISDESGNDEESSVMSTRKSVKISKSPSTVAAKRIRRAKYPVFGAQKKRKLCLAARRRVAQREAKKSGLRPNSNDDSSAGADERSEPDLQPSVMEFAEEKQQNEAVKAVSPLQCTANRTANNSFEQKFTEVEPEKALMTCAALVESDDNSEEKGAVVVKNVSPVKSEPSEIKLSMIPLQPQSPPLNLELSHSSGLASPGPNRTHCAQCDTYVAHLKYHVWARHCARMPYGCLQCDFRSWCQSYVVKHAKHKHTRASNALVSKPTIEMQNEYFKFYGLVSI